MDQGPDPIGDPQWSSRERPRSEETTFKWVMVGVLYTMSVVSAIPGVLAASGFPFGFPLAALPLVLLAIAVVLHVGLRRDSGRSWSGGATVVAALIVLGALMYTAGIVWAVTEGPMLGLLGPFAGFTRFGSYGSEVSGDGADLTLRSLGASPTVWFTIDKDGRGTVHGYTTGSWSSGPGTTERGMMGSFSIAVIDDSIDPPQKRMLDVYYDGKTTLSVGGKASGRLWTLFEGEGSGADEKVMDRVLTVKFRKQGDYVLAESVDAPAEPNAFETGP